MDYKEFSEFCIEYGVKPSTVGRKTMGDPRLAYTLRNGRILRTHSEAKVRAYMANIAAEAAKLVVVEEAPVVVPCDVEPFSEALVE
jgi:hypothetical protein